MVEQADFFNPICEGSKADFRAEEEHALDFSHPRQSGQIVFLR